MIDQTHNKMPNDSQPEVPSKDYPPWTKSLLINRVLFVKKISPFRAGCYVFLVYWIAPFILCLFSGTLLPKNRLLETSSSLSTKLPDLLPISELLNTLANTQQLSNVSDISYLLDKTHFIFALVISCGAGFATHIIRMFHITVKDLRNSNIPVAKEQDINLIYHKYRDFATHSSLKFLSYFLALFNFLVFFYLASASENQHWWGHRNYGFTGVVFSCIETLMVYWGTRVITLVALGSLMLYKIMKFPLSLRPFAADGCNGLTPLGHQIIALWLFSLTLAFAIYITLSFGYFGIEKVFVTWVLAGLGTLAIPALAILPLLSALKSIHKARRSRLTNYETILTHLMQKTELAALGGKSDEAVKNIEILKEIQEARSIVNTANVWPFNPRALLSILIINLIQIILTFDKLLGVFANY